MAFKMKGSPMYRNFGISPIKQKRGFDLKGYFKGEQGLIPDYKGKTTRSRMNQSRLFNPRSTDEVMSDRMYGQMYGIKLAEKNKSSRTGKTFSKEDDNYLKELEKNVKQQRKGLRPNKKDRY